MIRGVWENQILDASVFLGHRRLAIIDLSEAGRQPMSSQDGMVRITYNGEIYNFLDLKRELEKKGYRFRSRTDTEVVLHGYQEWGIEKLLERLNGMFAFAIYDARFDADTSRLLLARDRLGIKPLYYCHYDGAFTFASEIKALLALGNVPVEVNWQAISDYFTFLYIPHPHTAFRHIYQLPPGHYLTYDLQSQGSEIKKYWNPIMGTVKNVNGSRASLSDAKEELRFLLEDSVKQQMISDVPLGVFLSGGIDSTILTALAARASPGQLKTFTLLFKGEGIAPHDETQYARTVSERYNTDHHEIDVDLSQPTELLDLVSCFDQPFANPTFYLNYLISKKTKEHVTVALSGAGGDELFGGYPRYRALPYSSLLSALPQRLGQGVIGLLKLLPDNYEHLYLRRAKLLARGIGKKFSEQYLGWTYYLSDGEKLIPPLPRRGLP